VPVRFFLGLGFKSVGLHTPKNGVWKGKNVLSAGCKKFPHKLAENIPNPDIT
jgi:hypothetical protein